MTTLYILRGSMVNTATPCTGEPGSNPGRDISLIGGCGFESHSQLCFDTYCHGPNAYIVLCNGNALNGHRSVVSPC